MNRINHDSLTKYRYLARAKPGTYIVTGHCAGFKDIQIYRMLGLRRGTIFTVIKNDIGEPMELSIDSRSCIISKNRAWGLYVKPIREKKE